MSHYLRLLFIIFSVTYGVAQEKNEVEKRVKEDEIPNQAKEWLKDAFLTRAKNQMVLSNRWRKTSLRG
jgi:hypothetical protein